MELHLSPAVIELAAKTRKRAANRTMAQLGSYYLPYHSK